jgi:hypothetical protein
MFKVETWTPRLPFLNLLAEDTDRWVNSVHRLMWFRQIRDQIKWEDPCHRKTGKSLEGEKLIPYMTSLFSLKVSDKYFSFVGHLFLIATIQV